VHVKFYVVRASGRVTRLLYDKANATAVAQSQRGAVVEVDLGAGWDAETGTASHVSGAAVRPSSYPPGAWQYRVPDGSWEDTKRGQWFARWAALAFRVG
jgi:hypothetical protein